MSSRSVVTAAIPNTAVPTWAAIRTGKGAGRPRLGALVGPPSACSPNTDGSEPRVDRAGPTRSVWHGNCVPPRGKLVLAYGGGFRDAPPPPPSRGWRRRPADRQQHCLSTAATHVRGSCTRGRGRQEEQKMPVCSRPQAIRLADVVTHRTSRWHVPTQTVPGHLFVSRWFDHTGNQDGWTFRQGHADQTDGDACRRRASWHPAAAATIRPAG